MSKPKHTPGEWSVGVYETTETMIAHLKAKPQSCVCLVENGQPGMVIALCGDADDPQSQRDADLLAAAPKMLEALKAYFEIENASVDESISDHLTERFERMACAAIAKATGGEK